MRIKRIKRINAGIFRDYRPDSTVPPFQQFNLIYGFNGCGKTTLSKILMSLQPNMEMESYGWFEEDDWNFEIETSDGSLLEKGGELSNTRVFNQKYVEDNLGLNYGGGQSPALLVIG
jgi:wobble nucleotide-excising tRNase